MFNWKLWASLSGETSRRLKKNSTNSTGKGRNPQDALHRSRQRVSRLRVRLPALAGGEVRRASRRHPGDLQPNATNGERRRVLRGARKAVRHLHPVDVTVGQPVCLVRQATLGKKALG